MNYGLELLIRCIELRACQDLAARHPDDLNFATALNVAALNYRLAALQLTTRVQVLEGLGADATNELRRRLDRVEALQDSQEGGRYSEVEVSELRATHARQLEDLRNQLVNAISAQGTAELRVIARCAEALTLDADASGVTNAVTVDRSRFNALSRAVQAFKVASR